MSPKPPGSGRCSPTPCPSFQLRPCSNWDGRTSPLATPAGVRAVLRQTRDIFEQRPNLGVLPQQAAELRAKLTTITAGPSGASSLTTAELRLLPLLSTHLTLKEISERLYLSRNTVKTQAASIYRKFGVSSRGEAIARMHELGLLPHE